MWKTCFQTIARQQGPVGREAALGFAQADAKRSVYEATLSIYNLFLPTFIFFQGLHLTICWCHTQSVASLQRQVHDDWDHTGFPEGKKSPRRTNLKTQSVHYV